MPDNDKLPSLADLNASSKPQEKSLPSLSDLNGGVKKKVPTPGDVESPDLSQGAPGGALTEELVGSTSELEPSISESPESQIDLAGVQQAQVAGLQGAQVPQAPQVQALQVVAPEAVIPQAPAEPIAPEITGPVITPEQASLGKPAFNESTFEAQDIAIRDEAIRKKKTILPRWMGVDLDPVTGELTKEAKGSGLKGFVSTEKPLERTENGLGFVVPDQGPLTEWTPHGSQVSQLGEIAKSNNEKYIKNLESSLTDDDNKIIVDLAKVYESKYLGNIDDLDKFEKGASVDMKAFKESLPEEMSAFNKEKLVHGASVRIQDRFEQRKTQLTEDKRMLELQEKAGVLAKGGLLSEEDFAKSKTTFTGVSEDGVNQYSTLTDQENIDLSNWTKEKEISRNGYVTENKLIANKGQEEYDKEVSALADTFYTDYELIEKNLNKKINDLYDSKASQTEINKAENELKTHRTTVGALENPVDYLFGNNLHDNDKIYDPATGKRIGLEEATPAIIEWNKRVDVEALELSKTNSKEDLKAIQSRHYADMKYLEGQIARGMEGKFSSDLDKSTRSFKAASKALDLNSSIASVQRNAMDRVIESAVEAVGFEMDTPEDEVRDYQEMISNEGLQLTDEEKDRVEQRFVDKLGSTVGGSIPVMLEIMFWTAVTEGTGTVGAIERGIAKLGSNLARGEKSAKMINGISKVVSNAANREIQFQLSGETGGAGESLGAELGTALGGNLAFLGNSRIGRVLRTGFTQAGRATGETIEEYSGELWSELAKGEDWSDAFGTVIGDDPMEKLALTFITGSIFAVGKVGSDFKDSKIAQEMAEAVKNSDSKSSIVKDAQDLGEKLYGPQEADKTKKEFKGEDLTSEDTKEPKGIVKEVEGELSEIWVDGIVRSDNQIIENLSDPKFVEKVKSGKANLDVKNPSPEVKAALEESGLLEENKEDVKEEITPETKVDETPIEGEQQVTKPTGSLKERTKDIGDVNVGVILDGFQNVSGNVNESFDRREEGKLTAEELKEQKDRGEKVLGGIGENVTADGTKRVFTLNIEQFDGTSFSDNFGRQATPNMSISVPIDSDLTAGEIEASLRDKAEKVLTKAKEYSGRTGQNIQEHFKDAIDKIGTKFEAIEGSPTAPIETKQQATGDIETKTKQDAKIEETKVDETKVEEAKVLEEPVAEVPKMGTTNLTQAIDESKVGEAGVLTNDQKVFEAIKEVSKDVSEETGLTGQKLINEVAKRVNETSDGKINAEDVIDLGNEILPKKVKEAKVTTEPSPEAKKETIIESTEEAFDVIDKSQEGDVNKIGYPIEVVKDSGVFLSKNKDNTYNVSHPDKRTNSKSNKRSNLSKQEAQKIIDRNTDFTTKKTKPKTAKEARKALKPKPKTPVEARESLKPKKKGEPAVKLVSEGKTKIIDKSEAQPVHETSIDGKQVFIQKGAFFEGKEWRIVEQREIDGKKIWTKKRDSETLGLTKAEALQSLKAEAKTKGPKVFKKQNAGEVDKLTKEAKSERQKSALGTIKNIIKALGSINPDIEVLVHENEASYLEALGDEAKGTSGALDTDGKIHLNLSNIKNNTALHEAAHVVVAAHLKANPEAITEFKKQLEGILPKSDLESLNEFADGYYVETLNEETNEVEISGEEDVSEEFVIEALSRIANGTINLDKTTLDKVKEFLRAIAKSLGMDSKQIKLTGKEDVKQFAKKLTEAFAEGKVLNAKEELEVLKPLEEQEQGGSGEVGTIKFKKNVKTAPSSKTDTRAFANLVEDVDIKKFNGKKFITNMYDFTTAGEIDLGNGHKVNLFGGKSYVPFMMNKKGLKLGDVSNLAAFNTKENAQGFIDSSVNSGAKLFMPHSGTIGGSWQFQHSIFEALTNLALDDKILSKKELIETFNTAITSKDGKSYLKQFNEKYKEATGKTVKNFDSFKNNPSELLRLLDANNNYAPNLRKALNDKLSANVKFQEALGVKNKPAFAKKMMDPMNEGVEGGELMGVIEFDNTTFEIKKTKEGDVDHHPSFGWTVLAKIKGIFQPTEFHQSVDVTESYTKYNKDGISVSTRTDSTEKQYELAKKGKSIDPKTGKLTREAKSGKIKKSKPFEGTFDEFKESKFDLSNVSSSAGSIPKVAETNIETVANPAEHKVEGGKVKFQKTPKESKLFREPNQDVINVSEEYKKSKGITAPPAKKITELDVENSKRIADAYDKMEHNPSDPAVKKAYTALANEVTEQFNALTDAGFKIEIYKGKGEPYANSEAMLNDLRDNKRLYSLSTEADFGKEGIDAKLRVDNPMLDDSGLKDVNGVPLLVNDLFRFVHDVFGHGEQGTSFGAIGEENAWNVHSKLFSDEARKALTTETRGQNSWVNFGPQMRNADGSVMQKGDAGYMNASERPFADQKNGLLPDSMVSPEKAKFQKGDVDTKETSDYIDSLKESGFLNDISSEEILEDMQEGGYDVDLKTVESLRNEAIGVEAKTGPIETKKTPKTVMGRFIQSGLTEDEANKLSELSEKRPTTDVARMEVVKEIEAEIGLDKAYELTSDPKNKNQFSEETRNYFAVAKANDLKNKAAKTESKTERDKLASQAGKIIAEISLEAERTGQINQFYNAIYNEFPEMHTAGTVVDVVNKKTAEEMNAPSGVPGSTVGEEIEGIRAGIEEEIRKEIEKEIAGLKEQVSKLKEKKAGETQKVKGRKQISDALAEIKKIKNRKGPGSLAGASIIPGVSADMASAIAKLVAGYVNISVGSTKAIVSKVMSDLKEAGVKIKKSDIETIANSNAEFAVKAVEEVLGKETKLDVKSLTENPESVWGKYQEKIANNIKRKIENKAKTSKEATNLSKLADSISTNIKQRIDEARGESKKAPKKGKVSAKEKLEALLDNEAELNTIYDKALEEAREIDPELAEELESEYKKTQAISNALIESFINEEYSGKDLDTFIGKTRKFDDTYDPSVNIETAVDGLVSKLGTKAAEKIRDQIQSKFSEKVTNKALDNSKKRKAKDQENKLQEAIEDFYVNGKSVKTTLAEHLADELDITKEQAQEVLESNGLEAKIEAKVREKASKELDKNLKKSDDLTSEERAERKEQLAENNKIVNKISKTIKLGALANRDFTNDFSEKYGFTKVSADQMALLEELVNEAKRFEESGQRELHQKTQRRINTELKKMKPKDAAFYGKLAMELAYLNALSGMNTQGNANIGALSTSGIHLLGKAISLVAGGKIGALAYGVKAMSKSLKAASKAAKEGRRFNYSKFQDHNSYMEGSTNQEMGIVEAEVVKGFGHYLSKVKSSESASDNTKNILKAIGSTFLQYARMNFLLNASDAFLTTQFSEFNNAVEEYNKEMKGAGISGRINSIINRKGLVETLDKAMGYDQKSKFEAAVDQEIDLEKAKIDEEVNKLHLSPSKAKAEKKRRRELTISRGYKARRVHELMTQERDQEVYKEAVKTARDWIMLSDPDGILGAMNESLKRSINLDARKDPTEIRVLGTVFVGLTIMFSRMTAKTANAVMTSIPVIGMIPAAFGVAKNKEGKWRPAFKPKRDMLLFKRRILANMLMTTAGGAVFAEMFNWDDDDEEWKLDPNRLIDVTSGTKGDEQAIKGATYGVGISYRNSPDEEFGPYRTLKYAPQALPMASIIGYFADQSKGLGTKSQQEGFNEAKKSYTGLISGTSLSVSLSQMLEGSFNSIGRSVKKITQSKADNMGEKVAEAAFDLTTSPLKTITQPNFYRDLINESGVRGDVKKAYPKDFFGKLKYDYFGLDAGAENKTDIFGYEYKTQGKLSQWSNGTMNDNYDKPEWEILLKYPQVSVPVFKAKEDIHIDGATFRLGSEELVKEYGDFQKLALRTLLSDKETLEKLNSIPNEISEAVKDIIPEELKAIDLDKLPAEELQKVLTKLYSASQIIAKAKMLGKYQDEIGGDKIKIIK